MLQSMGSQRVGHSGETEQQQQKEYVVYIYIYICIYIYMGFSSGSDDKEFACNAGDSDSVPGLGRSSGGGHGNPLQYSCLESSMDRGT